MATGDSPPRIPPRDRRKTRRGGIPHVHPETGKSWPAQRQPGGDIVKEHGQTRGRDAQEIKPSTVPTREVAARVGLTGRQLPGSASARLPAGLCGGGRESRAELAREKVGATSGQHRFPTHLPGFLIQAPEGPGVSPSRFEAGTGGVRISSEHVTDRFCVVYGGLPAQIQVAPMRSDGEVPATVKVDRLEGQRQRP